MSTNLTEGDMIMTCIRTVAYQSTVLVGLVLALTAFTGCQSTSPVKTANTSTEASAEAAAKSSTQAFAEDLVGVWAYQGDEYEGGQEIIGPGKMVILERGDDLAAFLRRDGRIQYVRFEIMKQGDRFILSNRQGSFHIRVRLEDDGKLRGVYESDSNTGPSIGKNNVRGNVSIRNQDQNLRANTRGRFEANRVSTEAPAEAS